MPLMPLIINVRINVRNVKEVIVGFHQMRVELIYIARICNAFTQRD